MDVITRYAPSPTGMPHLGGSRTALYNFLLAKHNGGKFLLRIEDTDRRRSAKEAEKAIIESLEWLGIRHDGEIVYQSTRTEIYQNHVADMLKRGTAFKCYESIESLQSRRNSGQSKLEKAKDSNLSDSERQELQIQADELLAAFRSPWRDGGKPPSADTPYTIRLRAPDKGSVAINDIIHGQITVQAKEIDDIVLLRADQTPTYLLAVVVDEVEMGITHIVRGDDHLLNTVRQSVIYGGLGWKIPQVGHLPLIHGTDGKKLSKRDAATNVLDYRAQGFLPEAMISYLTRLGWSYGNQEIFTMEKAITHFSLDNVHKSPARLDLDKLESVNEYFIRSCETNSLFQKVKPFLLEKCSLTARKEQLVKTALPVLKERASTLPKLSEMSSFLLVERPIELNKKARKTVHRCGLERLSVISDRLARLEDWNENSLQECLNLLCSSLNLTFGEVGSPIRASVTGGLPAPDLVHVLYWIGKNEVLLRIQDQLDIMQD